LNDGSGVCFLVISEEHVIREVGHLPQGMSSFLLVLE